MRLVIQDVEKFRKGYRLGKIIVYHVVVFVKSVIYRNIRQMNLLYVLVLFRRLLIRNLREFRKALSVVIGDERIRLGNQHINAQIHFMAVYLQETCVVFLDYVRFKRRQFK